MKKIAPSTIMFNTSADFKVFSLVAKWAGVKNILYRRDNGSAIKPSLINQFLLKRITFFLPCSEFIGQIANAKKNNLIPRKKMVIIPNSISLEAWDSKVTAPQKLSTGKGIVKLGCIGRLSKEKGQHFLPKIAEELRQTEKNFKIFIAGTGPAEDELKKEIIHLGLEKHFELLGFVKSNKAFVEAIDCLLLPSMWEGLPTTALEAMAGSKPVLAFSVAGNPEVVLHKQTGLLIKPFETATFAHEIKGLINSPKTMTEMGKKGRELVEKKYSKAITNQQLNPFFI